MKCTSGKKPWKEELLERWDMLVRQYRAACIAPSLRLWLKVIIGMCKIFLSVMLRKVLERVFEDF